MSVAGARDSTVARRSPDGPSNLRLPPGPRALRFRRLSETRWPRTRGRGIGAAGLIEKPIGERIVEDVLLRARWGVWVRSSRRRVRRAAHGDSPRARSRRPSVRRPFWGPSRLSGETRRNLEVSKTNSRVAFEPSSSGRSSASFSRASGRNLGSLPAAKKAIRRWPKPASKAHVANRSCSRTRTMAGLREGCRSRRGCFRDRMRGRRAPRCSMADQRAHNLVIATRSLFARRKHPQLPHAAPEGAARDSERLGRLHLVVRQRSSAMAISASRARGRGRAGYSGRLRAGPARPASPARNAPADSPALRKERSAHHHVS